MSRGPRPPAEYNHEHPYTDETLEAEGWATGLDVWETVGNGCGDYVGDYAVANAQLWSLYQAIREQVADELDEHATRMRAEYRTSGVSLCTIQGVEHAAELIRRPR